MDSRKAIVQNLSSLSTAGVKMIVETDAGIPLCHFERYVDGLTVLEDAGYTTREILRMLHQFVAYPLRLGGLPLVYGRPGSLCR